MDPKEDPISLRREQADYVRRQIQAGRFVSLSEIVNEALRQMEAGEQVPIECFGMTKEEIRRRIEEGLAAAQRGEFVDGEAFMDELDELDRAERERRHKRAS
jgi:putative addiction module CopG family antidote